MRVYIINGRATRKKLDDISHRGYLMGYEATTGVIIYWKPDQPFVIHRAHYVCFDEYNSSLSIEDKHTPGSLIIWKDPESHIHISDLINLIQCELDLTFTPFSDTQIIIYEIELPPSGKKFGFNLLDDEYFTIPYITDTIPNSPDGHQIPSQANRNVSIIAINGKEPITDQGVLDELNFHQTPRGKSKIKISLCRRKIYQRTDIGEIRSIFDQVRPVFSHIEVILPKEPPTPKNIGEGVKGPQKQFRKEAIFVKYEKNISVSLILLPSQSNPPLKEKYSSIHSLLLVLRKVTVLMHGNVLHTTVQIEFLILNVLILINHTVQWHMLTSP